MELLTKSDLYGVFNISDTCRENETRLTVIAIRIVKPTKLNERLAPAWS